jgi:ribosomal protein S8
MKVEIEALSAKVMGNKGLLAQSKANIEQNRMLVLSNYVAAMAGNHQLAAQNMQDIYSSRNTIFELMQSEDEDYSAYVAAVRAGSELDMLGHSIGLNRKNLELNQKMIKLNQQLTAVNEEIMQLNQEMLEFNEENLISNQDLMSGALHPLLVDEETLESLAVENEKTLAELEDQADENRQAVVDLLAQSKENRSVVLKNATQISDRKKSLYKNMDEIASMREKIGAPITITDIFMGEVWNSQV